jgi:hypothetical protein
MHRAVHIAAEMWWVHAGAGNSKHIQTLTSLATLLLAALRGNGGASGEPCSRAGGVQQQQQPAALQTVNDFLFSAGLDNINLFRLIRRAQEGRRAQPRPALLQCCWRIFHRRCHRCCWH